MRVPKEHAERTRESLLKAGLKVFSEKGFAATRLEDIAQGAGVTRGAIYWHFKNKLELFCELFLTFIQLFFADAQNILQSNHSPDEKIRRLLIQIPTNFIDDEDYRAIGALYYRIEWTEEVKKMLATSFKRVQAEEDAPFIAIIEAGKLAGIFRKDIATSIIIKTLKTFFVGLSKTVLEHPSDPLSKEDIPAVVDCFLKGILSDTPVV
jgi:AcrR family transcriptional regulator